LTLKQVIWKLDVFTCDKSILRNLTYCFVRVSLASALHSSDFVSASYASRRWSRYSYIKRHSVQRCSLHCYMCTLLILCVQRRNVGPTLCGSSLSRACAESVILTFLTPGFVSLWRLDKWRGKYLDWIKETEIRKERRNKGNRKERSKENCKWRTEKNSVRATKAILLTSWSAFWYLLVLFM
jgi:hypothetical protein